jgi:D-alanine-D-alanine ligase
VSVTVAIIFGGPTPEHEVSLAGARCVARHAAHLGWTVLPMGITKGSEWLVGPDALAELWRRADPELMPSSAAAEPMPESTGRFAAFDRPPAAVEFAGVDAVFPIGHGRLVEDGVLQGLLAWYGLPVIGCDVSASAVCFDKRLARAVLSAAGLPVAAGVYVSLHEHTKDAAETVGRVRNALGAGLLFVKPARSGCSLGISAVDDDTTMHRALETAFAFDTFAVVEEFVPHRELVIGVVGDCDDVVVSPPGECIAIGDLYTYEEKYHLGNPGFTCPADLDADTTTAAQSLAAEAYRATGCSGFARVDLFVDRRTGGLLVNEINTIPGLTDVSVFPKVMSAAGWDYPRLLTELYRTRRVHGG